MRESPINGHNGIYYVPEAKPIDDEIKRFFDYVLERMINEVEIPEGYGRSKILEVLPEVYEKVNHEIPDGIYYVPEVEPVSEEVKRAIDYVLERMIDEAGTSDEIPDGIYKPTFGYIDRQFAQESRRSEDGALESVKRLLSELMPLPISPKRKRK